MTEVPRRMPSPRERIHHGFCPDMGGCRYIGGRNHDSTKCLKLDELLDLNDEMLLHQAARDLRDSAMRMPDYRPPKYGTTGRMATLANADRIDPYVRVTGDDSGSDINCPSCVQGKEHYHRKSDGTPVRLS
jgi:hypothetical protein